MNAQELLNEAYRTYQGKIASRTPVWASDKANVVIEIANAKQKEWANDSNVTWVSNFRSDITAAKQPGTVATAGTTTLTGTGTHFTDFAVGDTITVSGETVRTIGTITSDTVLTVTVAFTNTASSLTFTRRPIIKVNTQEYSLHRSFYTPSDEIVVTTTQDITFGFASPKNRENGDAYISGRNPKMLTFYGEIATGNQLIGGTLKVPGYYTPDTIVNSTDIISVDDPEWLVLITAAEMCRNKTSKADQFANLTAMANERYTKMISANNELGYLNGGTIPVNMPAIGSTNEE